VRRTTVTPPGSPASTLTAVGDDVDVSTNTTFTLQSADMNALADESQRVNDIINAAQQLLSHQYTSISGLKDTVVLAASTCDVLLHSDIPSNTVQIVHDSVKERWLCVTNKHCSAGHLRTYCSLQMIPSTHCLATVTRLFCLQSPSLTIDIMNAVRQAGSIDCRLFAIAYAEMLARDLDPCNVNLDQPQMRMHLVRCLEAKHIRPFPVIKFRTIRRLVVRSVVVSLLRNAMSGFTSDALPSVTDDLFEHLAQPTVQYSCPQCAGVNNINNDQLGAGNVDEFRCMPTAVSSIIYHCKSFLFCS